MQKSTSEANLISADGLRYISKNEKSVSATFAGVGTISCIICGVHRPRSTLVPMKIAGRPYFRCAVDCRQ